MQKFRVPEIFLGALLTVAIFAMGMMFSSLPSQNNKQNNQPAQAAEQIRAPSPAEERVADYTLALAWLTAVLAASTVGLWVVTWRSGVRQSRDMESMIGAARDDFDATHRPWIPITNVTLDFGLKWVAGNALVGLNVFCKNTGNSPAQRVSLGVAIFPFLRNDDIPAKWLSSKHLTAPSPRVN